MKVLVVMHDNKLYSGASRSMLSIIENWEKRGVNVAVLIPGKGDLLDVMAERGIKVLNTPSVKARLNLGHGFLHRFIARCVSIFSMIFGFVYCKFILAPKLKNEKVDVIYSNTTSVIMGYYLKKMLKLPHVWHIREFGLLDQNCEFTLGRKNLNKKLNDSQLLIAISKAVYSAYSDDVYIPMEVVYNDVSDSYIDMIERNWGSSEITVLSCGSLIPGKGHMDVIKAVAKLHQKGFCIKLLIAGQGEEHEKELYQLIKILNAGEYIKLLGQVKDMKSLRKKCHIGVVASKMEAFGRVTVEGMLSGMLMIGADSGGTSEIISDGKTGFLYEVGNPEDLAEKIVIAYNDRGLMKNIAKKGFTDAQKYTCGNCAEKILHYMRDYGIAGIEI